MIIFQIEVNSPYELYCNRHQLTVENESFAKAAAVVNQSLSLFEVANPRTVVCIGTYCADPKTGYFKTWLSCPTANHMRMPLRKWVEQFGDIK